MAKRAIPAVTDAWPFDQPRNCATLTSTHVMREGKLVTRVYHDEDDHGWQFYSEEGSSTSSALIVTLEEVVTMDLSLLKVAHLPPGWQASRASIEDTWHFELQYADASVIAIDWSKLSTEEEFFDAVLPQCASPSWHGRNLDALQDSWVTGGIDKNGPPYAFRFLAGNAGDPAMALFRSKVEETARRSVDENGGRLEFYR